LSVGSWQDLTFSPELDNGGFVPEFAMGAPEGSTGWRQVAGILKANFTLATPGSFVLTSLPGSASLFAYPSGEGRMMLAGA
jgi:hypothetical protein